MTPPLPLRVAFLTGQSNPRSWMLSSQQSAFLDRLRLPNEVLHRLNFPYREGSAPHAQVSLPKASASNLIQYLGSRRDSFRDKHLSKMIEVVSAAEHTILLAGSCGLELLANLRLPPPWLQRLSVFAYGPVARARPQCCCLLIRGRQDRISRWFFPSVDHLVDADHLNYLEQPEVLDLCVGFLSHVTRSHGLKL
jgi:hypothetical protein